MFVGVSGDVAACPIPIEHYTRRRDQSAQSVRWAKRWGAIPPPPTTICIMKKIFGGVVRARREFCRRIRVCVSWCLLLTRTEKSQHITQEEKGG